MSTGPSRAVVEVVRDRDGWACVRCGSGAGLSTQHRHARGMGGTRDPRVNDPDNLITLCGHGTTGCHGEVESLRVLARTLGLGLADWQSTSTPVVAWDGVWLLDRDGGRTPAPADLCIEWQGARNARGYGDMNARGHRIAHRAVWSWYRGPIPDGLLVLHSCDNRPCVRPDHLRVGTAAENTADMMMRGRQVAPTGLANGKSKLSPEEVDAIRVAVRGGESRKSVGRRLGLHPSYVGRLVSGERRPGGHRGGGPGRRCGTGDGEVVGASVWGPVAEARTGSPWAGDVRPR